jgi:hypothetical protein
MAFYNLPTDGACAVSWSLPMAKSQPSIRGLQLDTFQATELSCLSGRQASRSGTTIGVVLCPRHTISVSLTITRHSAAALGLFVVHQLRKEVIDHVIWQDF